MRIRAKLLIAFLITTLVPIATVGILSISQIMDEAYEHFESSSSLNMSLIDKNITDFFDSIAKQVTFISELSAVTQTDAGQISTYFGEKQLPAEVALNSNEREREIFNTFRELGESNPLLSYIYMGDVNGGYLEWPGSSGYGSWDPRKRPWYESGRDANFNIAKREAYYWEPDDTVYVSVVKGYKDQSNTFNGVVAMDVSLKTLTDLVKSIQFGKSGRIMMIEGNGTILVDGANPENNFKRLKDLNAPYFRVLENAEAGVTALEIEGVPYMANIYKSPVLGWTFIGMMKTSDVTESARRIAIMTVIVCVFLILGCMLGAVWIAQGIVAPINDVKNNLRILAEGEGDLTTRITVQTTDETGELARWFNQFMDSTQSLIYNIKHTAHEMHRISDDVSNNAVHMASSTVEQQGNIDQIAAATSQMSTSADEVARNSEETASIADVGLSTTQQGKTVVDQSRKNVEKLVENIQTGNCVIQELSDETNNITNILTTIQGIAEQTNLLALNAAIEAARAGESGRGFAVVADEVRSLAQRTHQSTEEVGVILEKLVSKTNTVKSTMECSVKDSEQTLLSSTAAIDAFVGIESAVQNIRDMTVQTAGATEQQHMVTKDINKNIVRVSDSASEIAELSSQVQHLCHKQTDTVDELEQLLNRFKT